MAKCAICKSRKGKRKCKAEENTLICSLCCGQSRNSDKCEGCSFYKDASSNRNYRKVPFFELNQMSQSFRLQEISNTIESTLCRIELESKEPFLDKDASGLIELLFDKYHFKDEKSAIKNPFLESIFIVAIQIIEKDLSDVSEDDLEKVLATVYRSIHRRTNGGREYLEFANDYVGTRVGSGVRALPLDGKL